MTHTTALLPADPTGIAQAAALLRAGAVVSFPTETVYGLGGDARNPLAVAEIFKAKGRPSFNPLIVHVADLAAAQRIGAFSPLAVEVAQAFWPGPLTVVVPLLPEAGIADLALAGLATVALRVPAHPLAQRLLAVADLALAAPSANPSGQISPTTAEHVIDGLGGKIAAVLEGGACAVGLESTIIACDDARGPRLLRPGGIPTTQIEALLHRPLAQDTTPQSPSAPGQLASHYAPHAPVRLNATGAAEGGVFLGFGPGAETPYSLSPEGDLAEAAARLFALLRQLDALRPTEIAVAPIPDRGLGQAINDRLRRAAAPRT